MGTRNSLSVAVAKRPTEFFTLATELAPAGPATEASCRVDELFLEPRTPPTTAAVMMIRRMTGKTIFQTFRFFRGGVGGKGEVMSSVEALL
jgi:hypothetical protein